MKKLNDDGKIEIRPNNIYLVKSVNYTEFKNVFEWECIAETKCAYKFCDKIQERVFWVEKTKFHSSAFGQGGYHVFDIVHDECEETKKNFRALKD